MDAVQNSLTLFLFFVGSRNLIPFPFWVAVCRSEIVRENWLGWRGRPLMSCYCYEEPSVPVATQSRLRREESPHGRFAAFFTLAIPTEAFMSHSQTLRICHPLHIHSACKIILVSLSGKRAFPPRKEPCI